MQGPAPNGGTVLASERLTLFTKAKAACLTFVRHLSWYQCGGLVSYPIGDKPNPFMHG